MGVKHRSGEVGGRGEIADCHIDVSPVGGGDETAVGPGRSTVPGEGATGAKVGEGSIDWGEYEGLLGED